MKSPSGVPELGLFGQDLGDKYEEWLRARNPNATVELWANLGHYPHLVSPHNFVQRVLDFDAKTKVSK